MAVNWPPITEKLEAAIAATNALGGITDASEPGDARSLIATANTKLSLAKKALADGASQEPTPGDTKILKDWATWLKTTGTWLTGVANAWGM